MTSASLTEAACRSAVLGALLVAVACSGPAPVVPPVGVGGAGGEHAGDGGSAGVGGDAGGQAGARAGGGAGGAGGATDYVGYAWINEGANGDRPLLRFSVGRDGAVSGKLDSILIEDLDLEGHLDPSGFSATGGIYRLQSLAGDPLVGHVTLEGGTPWGVFAMSQVPARIACNDLVVCVWLPDRVLLLTGFDGFALLSAPVTGDSFEASNGEVTFRGTLLSDRVALEVTRASGTKSYNAPFCGEHPLD